ncbi:MAG TPA: 16S rRNA (guanine(966)-N(2))-methyltransferase RsmD [Actinomycetota bacterium]|nr:16S rRNA (guanine(966)-N(2))-methyltransferase RsmD [Actinomycetota bacterium]
MSLRIVAGEFGGRRIETPAGRGTRPTADRVREAWFSALGDRVVGARVLDLFAGSGALGLEALSRGAARAHFVESDGRAAAVLRRNIAALGVAERTEVTVGDAFVFLPMASGRGLPFDLVLADPPYGSDAAFRLVSSFGEEPFAGLLCVEHATGALDELPEVAWRRAYADTELTFVAAGDPEAASGTDDHGASAGEGIE